MTCRPTPPSGVWAGEDAAPSTGTDAATLAGTEGGVETHTTGELTMATPPMVTDPITIGKTLKKLLVSPIIYLIQSHTSNILHCTRIFRII